MRHSPCGRRNRLGRVRGTSSGRLGIRPRWSSIPLGDTHTDCGGHPRREIRLASAVGFGSTHRRFGVSLPHPLVSPTGVGFLFCVWGPHALCVVVWSRVAPRPACLSAVSQLNIVCPRLFESGNRGPRARVVVSSKSGRPPQVGTSGVISAQARSTWVGVGTLRQMIAPPAGWPAKSLIFQFSPERIVGVTGN